MDPLLRISYHGSIHVSPTSIRCKKSLVSVRNRSYVPKAVDILMYNGIAGKPVS